MCKSDPEIHTLEVLGGLGLARAGFRLFGMDFDMLMWTHVVDHVFSMAN